MELPPPPLYYRTCNGSNGHYGRTEIALKIEIREKYTKEARQDKSTSSDINCCHYWLERRAFAVEALNVFRGPLPNVGCHSRISFTHFYHIAPAMHCDFRALAKGCCRFADRGEHAERREPLG